jgi:hypothetical protein
MHLALLDATGYVEAMWQRTTVTRKFTQQVPRVSEDGVPVIDPDTGKPVTDAVESLQKITKYDDVRWVRRQLKDVGMIPAYAPSPQEAAAVWIVEWLYESDLMALMADSTEREVGQWWADMVENALSYVDSGTSDDVASDRQGFYDKTLGGQLEVGNAQGSHTSRFFKQRGPIKVFRIHSDEYDLDGDGVCEENIFYYHDRTQMMLGWMPYEYLTDERPIFDFSASPRPMEAIGYSMPMRLGVLSAEISKMYNDRNNAVDIKTSPPRIRRAGTKMDTNHNQYGPDVEWEGEPDSITFLQTPDIPVASFQQESLTKQYVTELTGQNQPAMGAQSSGRRTATENRIQAASTGTRNDLIVMRFRVAVRALINFTHRLKLQYMSDEEQNMSDAGGAFTISKEVLSQDYRIDVSGASDPLDAATRLSQDMGIYELLAQDPDVQSDPVKRYYLKRKLLEDAGTQNIEQIIGTAEEAMQLKAAMQQQAQQQAAMGQPPGGAQPQQQGKPQNGKAPAHA